MTVGISNSEMTSTLCSTREDTYLKLPSAASPCNLLKVLGLPGLRAIATPLTAVGALLPTNKVYQRMGTETISIIGWLFGDPLIYTTSMVVARQIVAVRGPLVKPEDSSRGISQWGPNLFQANGDDWRRHRRIVQPAFNGDIGFNLFDDMSFVDLSPVNEITTKFTLKIISRCAFGNYSSWDPEPTDANSTPDGNSDHESEKMDFTEALAIASESSLIHLITPRWMLRNVDIAYRKLGVYMESLHESSQAKQKQDLFSLMIKSSQEEGPAGMSDDELISNTYLMLFAGHDTTSNTLDSAIGFLALYQDVQEEIYEEIKDAVTGDPNLSFDAYSKLVKTQAAFLEAGRLFPAGFIMIRQATEDMVLTTDDPHLATNGGRLPVAKGTTLVVDMVGMHYNERYFPDPEEFRPSRWYDTKENDMSMFSFGSRACIGRRFALTEAVLFLSRLLLNWRLEPILNEGETPAEWRKRVMVAKVKMSLGLDDVPVRLIPRR
ncbi:cytochrome P450, partial [Irpex lacteus]